MRILLSNDDGVSAKGLEVLEKVAKLFGDDIWIVAPEVDQSGAGHSLTLRKPFRIREVSNQKFGVSGTPTDCIMTGIRYLMKGKKPDLILSGVNNGCNLAEDVIYSGTIAAAMEGRLLGFPSIALSLGIENDKPPQWDMVAALAPKIIKKLLPFIQEDNVIFNVNFPNIALDKVKGIKITTQGERHISDELVERIDPRGQPYYWIGSAAYRKTDIWEHAEPGTDLEAIGNKMVSITPLCLNMTHQPTKEKLVSEIF